MIPRYFFLTHGVGKHKEPLVSFELALRDGGIQQFNLVNVSSIVPPKCQLITKERGLEMLKPGEITFTVLVKNPTNEPHRWVTSSIGVAILSDEGKYGYLSEYHCFGKTPEEAGDYAEELAAYMIATTEESQLGTEEKHRGEKQSSIERRGMETSSITGSAEGVEDGLWTTVIAAAVFIL